MPQKQFGKSQHSLSVVTDSVAEDYGIAVRSCRAREPSLELHPI
jgi:hypothetical protein